MVRERKKEKLFSIKNEKNVGVGTSRSAIVVFNVLMMEVEWCRTKNWEKVLIVGKKWEPIVADAAETSLMLSVLAGLVKRIRCYQIQ